MEDYVNYIEETIESLEKNSNPDHFALRLNWYSGYLGIDSQQIADNILRFKSGGNLAFAATIGDENQTLDGEDFEK